MEKYNLLSITFCSNGHLGFHRSCQWYKPDGSPIGNPEHWRTTVPPTINLDLVATLSSDGSTLDQDCINRLVNFIEPAIHSLWTETYVTDYYLSQPDSVDTVG